MLIWSSSPANPRVLIFGSTLKQIDYRSVSLQSVSATDNRRASRSHFQTRVFDRETKTGSISIVSSAVTRLVWGRCSDPSLQKHLRIFICCDTQFMYFNVACYCDNFLLGRERKTPELPFAGWLESRRSDVNELVGWQYIYIYIYSDLKTWLYGHLVFNALLFYIEWPVLWSNSHS